MTEASDESKRGKKAPADAGHPVHAGGRSKASYLEIARRLLAERTLRGGFIEPSLVGEPAWDILLSAYVADPTVPRSVVEACSVGGTPFIAGFRWFKVLEGAHLMERSHEARGDFAEARLTDHGRAMLESYFETIRGSNL
ncbi:MAG: hypothetical protein ACKOOL_02925 [Novosphingobium sp.]